MQIQTIKVTLISSFIGNNKAIRKILIGLGLTRLNKTILRKKTPEILGMINKINHMVVVEEYEC